MNKKTYISLFKKILLIRRFEEKIVELYPQQEIRCPVHLYIGQEGIASGVCLNLSEEDIVFSNHRSHGHYIAKGGDINKLMAELYGKESGCSQGRGGSMHLMDIEVNFYASTPIVSGSIPLAVGCAFAHKMQNKKGIAVVFFGEGAIEEGTFTESLNFAALKKLPVLFVCENNEYAIFSHINDRQPNRPLTDLPKSYTIPSFKGNGNNPIEVFKLSKKAIDLIKQDKGPAFLEFTTHRWYEHCGPNFDDHLGYRCEGYLTIAKNDCPLNNLKKYLFERRILSNKILEVLENEVRQMVEESVKFAKESKFPNKDSLYKYIYAE